MNYLCAIFLFCLAPALAGQSAGARPAQMLDLKHYSRVFGEERNLRIFLPPGYDRASGSRYPVVYYFHGWGQRYNAWGTATGNADTGTDYGGDNIASFVATHDVIVVKWDGYNPRTAGENYPRPYNIGPVETYRQFPLYFPELVEYIDTHFRTIANRDHRGVSGLSMGGFMSFWVAGKYPQLVGSSSNFMGSSEFEVGPKEFPVEYRHTEMYRNYEGVRTRIIVGKRDFIRWYHRRMNAVWDFVTPYHETAEFDATHGTPGMGQTLAFHMAAFRNPLPKPSLWHHADVYPSFEVWGYSVSTDRERPGFTVLENVSRSGFRSSVRAWLPDGALLPATTVRVSTDALYQPGTTYQTTDVNLDTHEASRGRQLADGEGRLHFLLNGARHELGIADAETPVLTVAAWNVAGVPWAISGKPVRLRLAVLNKGSRMARRISATATSPNPGVSFSKANLSIPTLDSEAQAAGEIEFAVQDPNREIVKLMVRLQSQDGDAGSIPVEVPLRRDSPTITEFRVLDGMKILLWRRAVEKDEGALGFGNADGIANPGETIAVAVPDGDAFRAVELFTSDSCVDNTGRLSDSWAGYDHVGETAKISLALISSKCTDGHEIPFFVRYALPQKPDHILKEGVVRVRVTGKDQTPPRISWAHVVDGRRLAVELRDGGAVHSVHATFTRDGAGFAVPLNDAGRDGDAAAGDSVFTGPIPGLPPGAYRLKIEARDEYGNSLSEILPGEFALPK